MTTLFSDGQIGSTMETAGDFSAWTATAQEAPTPAPSIVASPVHHGANAAKISPAAGWHPAWVYKDLGDQATAFMRFYFQADHLPDNNGDRLKIAGMMSTTALSGYFSSGAMYNVVWFNDAGTVKWRIYAPDGSVATSASSPSINTWYCVELKGVQSSSVGEFRLYVDGAEICALTGLNTNGTPMRYFALEGIVYAGAATNNFYDCVVVADAYVGPEAAGGQQLFTLINEMGY